MTDITICVNETCEKRKDCYRYRAIPSKFRQSYALFDEKDCEYFWPIEKGLRIISLKEVNVGMVMAKTE